MRKTQPNQQIDCITRRRLNSSVMRALAKFTLSFFTLVLVLTACKRQQESQLSRDDEMRTKLSGRWVFDAKFATGHVIHGTTTLAPDGRYFTELDLGRTNGLRIVNMEGTFHVTDGFLIEAVTKHSQTNVSVPYTNRSRIIRIDDRELVLDFEKFSGGVSATNPGLLRKQTK